MRIDREEARRIAALAHIELTEAGLDKMAAEMTEILGYIDQLREADVTGIDAGDATGSTPLREDTPRPSVPREAVERNAPRFAEGCFVVPKVIGES